MTEAPRPPDAGATIVVTLPGEIDMANADRVEAQLNAAFGPGIDVWWPTCRAPGSVTPQASTCW
jgi:hypothetical protein